MNFRNTMLAGLSALAISAAAGASHAQEAQPAPAPEVQQPTAAAPELNDGKLKSFAVAFLEVAKVGEQYRSKIEQAKSTDDQQKLQQEAGEKMVEVVNAQKDISVDEYNAIIQQAQANPELAQKINGHITEAAGGQATQPAAPATPSE